VLSALVRDRERVWMRAGWTVLCGFATLVTPLGIENWRQVLESMNRSHANAIQEWQPTPFPPENLAFWGLGVLLVVMTARKWKALARPSVRALVTGALVFLPLAVRWLGNVPAFAMVAPPAMSRLLFNGPPRVMKAQPVRIVPPAMALAVGI